MIWEGVAPTKKFKRDFYRKKDDWQERNFRMPEYFRPDVTANGLQFLS